MKPAQIHEPPAPGLKAFNQGSGDQRPARAGAQDAVYISAGLLKIEPTFAPLRGSLRFERHSRSGCPPVDPGRRRVLLWRKAVRYSSIFFLGRGSSVVVCTTEGSRPSNPVFSRPPGQTVRGGGFLEPGQWIVKVL